MNFVAFIFAQGAPLPPVSPEGDGGEKAVGLLTDDMAIMVGLGLVMLAVLAFFARGAFGNGGRSGGRRRKRVSESRSVPEASTLPAIPSPRETKRRRRRKRSHRPSNPTLGETGGLPPERDSVSSQATPTE